MDDQPIIVFITAPSKEIGKEIASALVVAKLAACVNMLGPIESIYTWEVGLTFNHFVLNLTPVILVVLLVTAALLHFKWGRSMTTDDEHRQRVLAMNERDVITDWVLLRQSLAVIALVIVSFVLARMIGLEPGTIAMFGAAILVLLDNWTHPAHKQTERVHATFGDIEWITLFFFIGLFVVVAGVERAGLLDWLGGKLVQATGGDLALTVTAVLWGSAILSAIVDNIPFVATMIPLIKSLAPEMGGPDAIEPLWWALALGACLGGNGTLVGASANLTTAGLAERAGVPFRFWAYSRRAFPLMLVSIQPSREGPI